MPQNLGILSTRRINGVMETLRDRREIDRSLRYLRRVVSVPATDGEIMARFTGNVYAAEIIADDQQAIVKDTGKFTLEQIKIPNIKHGTLITQEMVNLMARINAGGGVPADMGILSNWITNKEDNLLMGVRTTMNSLIAAMMLDSWSYEGYGIQVSGATWGMPSDLKLTVSPTWETANVATATPIANIDYLANQIAGERYGQTYNRITMSSAAFRLMIATDEFQAESQLFSQMTYPAGATFPRNNLETARAIASRLIGMEIEIDDSQYYTQLPAGTETAVRNLPANKVLLSNSEEDNNATIMDWANGIVTESVIADMVDIPGGGFGGPQYGPVSYATLPGTDLNPPNAILWAVARGFPRKHKLSSTAVLTVY